MADSRVLLVDDHDVVIEGIKSALDSLEGFVVLGMAIDGLQAVAQASLLRPDIVVMDINMPRLDGIEATRRITPEMPFVRVIGFSMHNTEEIERRMREAGAVAFLVKSGPPDALVEAIRASFSGHGRVPD